MHAEWPGRPAASAAMATLLLPLPWQSPTSSSARSAQSGWRLAVGAATLVAVLAYLLDSMDLVEAGEAAGIAMTTAVGLLLLCWATSLTRPDRNPVSWLLAQPNRGGLVRLGFLFLGFPFIVASARYTFVSLGSGSDAALAQSAVFGTVVAAGIAFASSDANSAYSWRSRRTGPCCARLRTGCSIRRSCWRRSATRSVGSSTSAT